MTPPILKDILKMFFHRKITMYHDLLIMVLTEGIIIIFILTAGMLSKVEVMIE